MPDESRVEYFQNAGMPVTDALRASAASTLPESEEVKLDTSALDEYREWKANEGDTTYIRFMLSHPRYTLIEPITQYRYLLFWNLESYAAADRTNLLPYSVHYKLFESLRTFLAGVVVATAMIAFTWKLTDIRLAVYGAGLAVLSVLLAMGVWLADSMEYPRHALNSMVLLRVGLLFVGFAALDGALLKALEIINTRRSKSVPDQRS